MGEKTLTFEVKEWEKVDVKGANCPKCKELMVGLAAGNYRNFLIYAYCPKCKQYYEGKDSNA